MLILLREPLTGENATYSHSTRINIPGVIAQSTPSPAATPPTIELFLPTLDVSVVSNATPGAGGIRLTRRMHCYRGRVVETADCGAHDGIRQEIAEGIAGAPAQGRVIDQLHRGSRVNGNLVVKVVRGDELS